jgi:hypothetical protein
VRLRADIQFVRQEGGVTAACPAVVDTGAPASVLPRDVWEGVDRRVLVDGVPLVGISKRKACEIPASLALVEAQLVDATGGVSRFYSFPAFLAQTDDVPLVLGFADLLCKFDCHFSFEKREAWVDER